MTESPAAMFIPALDGFFDELERGDLDAAMGRIDKFVHPEAEFHVGDRL